MTELSAALAARKISSVELTSACLERIAKLNRELNAFISTDEERQTSLTAARRADEQRARGDVGPLTGIPIAHKDILCTRDFRTTCGSRMLEKYRSPYDAHVVQELERAGAVVTGKTNMSVAAVQSADYLTAEQKGDIFFHNAARFLRLEPVTPVAPKGAMIPRDLLADRGMDARFVENRARHEWPTP